MDVKFWVGPSCSVTEMSATNHAARSATHFFATWVDDGELQLDAGQSMFIVGGRNSITKALIDIEKFNVRTTSGNLAVTVKVKKKALGKDKRVVQIHGLDDGPRSAANFRFDTKFVSKTEIRDQLEQQVWGNQY